MSEEKKRARQARRAVVLALEGHEFKASLD